jgi:hypothetical protein
MKKLYHILCPALLLMMAAGAAFGQRPRVATAEDSPKPEETVSKPTPVPAPAPKLAKAKYMGGYFGLRQKQEGTLIFDDRNRRLVFRDKEEREVLSLSYDAVVAAFADSEERRTMGDGTKTVVMSTAGILGLPALLLKKKFQYFTIQFKDPDTDVQGTTQFKMKDRELINSMVYALAQKAELIQRGQIYVRRKDTSDASESKKTEP